MHGKNKIQKLLKDSGEMLQVREIFPTIQGEGPDSGKRAVFIRLTGCHLACTFCDTEWDDDQDKYLDVETLADMALGVWGVSFQPTHSALARWKDSPFFVLTGGEPTRQNITLLIERILEKAPHARIQIETSGSFWREIMRNPAVSVIVSPKTSFVHPDVAQLADAYKYVIRATDALHPEFGTPLSSTQSCQDMVCLATPPSHLSSEDIYLSPCDEEDEFKNRANRIAAFGIAERYGYRLMLQIHKFFEAP